MTKNTAHVTRKIALVLNDDFSMYHFRGDLIRELVSAGHDVHVLVPAGNYLAKLESLGATCTPVAISRFLAPKADLVFLWQMYRICRRERFDIVHNMTIKPNVFGSVAARLAGAQRIVCLVSGMGFAFTGHDLAGRVVRTIASGLYRVGLNLSQRTWFQNSDDFERFVQMGLLPRSKGIVIRSGGINMTEFRPDSVSAAELASLREELKIPLGSKCVVMIAARLIWSKGVREFVEAARTLQQNLPEWRFVLLCPRDDESWESVPRDYVQNLDCRNLHLIDTFREDVKTFVALADIMVLPSYYPEGVPRTLLEGLAMAKPIITTNHPGCREVVDEGKNGLLVPPRDSAALADAIGQLAENEQIRLSFGRESRAKAALEFDTKHVVRRIIDELYEI